MLHSCPCRCLFYVPDLDASHWGTLGPQTPRKPLQKTAGAGCSTWHKIQTLLYLESNGKNSFYFWTVADSTGHTIIPPQKDVFCCFKHWNVFFPLPVKYLSCKPMMYITLSFRLVYKTASEHQQMNYDGCCVCMCIIPSLCILAPS